MSRAIAAAAFIVLTPLALAEVATEAPQELLIPATSEREAALEKKVDKALFFVNQQGRYVRHRIVEFDTDTLQVPDPIPVGNEGDTAFEFSMAFTPFEGETFILNNESAYIADVFGAQSIRWTGKIANAAGETVGEFMVSDLNGNFDFSSFAFFDTPSYGIRSIEGEDETVLVQMLTLEEGREARKNKKKSKKKKKKKKGE